MSDIPDEKTTYIQKDKKISDITPSQPKAFVRWANGSDDNLVSIMQNRGFSSASKSASQKQAGFNNTASKEPTNVIATFGNNYLNIPGLEHIKIPGDGHCLYHAVGIHIDQGQTFLRQIVAAHIEHNLEDFRPFICSSQGKTIEGYIDDIRQGKEWADNIDIEVLMRVLKKPIVVIGPDGKIINKDATSRFSSDPIFVCFNGHNHYDAFKLIPGYSVQNILKYLTQINDHPITRQSTYSQSLNRAAPGNMSSGVIGIHSDQLPTVLSSAEMPNTPPLARKK